MKIKRLVSEDFNNYKVCSMLIAFPHCSWKCGKTNCQNSELALAPNIEISHHEIVQQYVDNPLTKAIVFGGLEPLDDIDDVVTLIREIRVNRQIKDPIVIYTGYTREEILPVIRTLGCYENIIIKFGRYVPGHEPHFDEVLGVNLASDNQYAEVLS